MGRTATTGRRVAFTLVEMIIVIGIIALLAGLLLQAIMKVRSVGPRMQAKHEMGQLGVAVEQFKSTYTVPYVPPALILCSDYAAAAQANPTWQPALMESQQYLSRVWPKANFRNLASPPSPANPFPPNTAIPLDGNQVLVFLLGGVPPTDNRFTGGGWQGTRTGFLDSPTNPFNRQGNVCLAPASGAVAKGPFYEFKTDRVNENGHFLDPYKWPYYYFSSRNGNDYGTFGVWYQPVLNPTNNSSGFTAAGGYGGIQANTPLPGGGTSPPVDIPSMNPFAGLDNKFINANGFQIISAGRDNLPGPGGKYDPGTGEYSPGARGGDDIGNFGAATLSGIE